MNTIINTIINTINKHNKQIVILLIILFLLYLLTKRPSIKESFLTDNSVQQFLQIQNTINPHTNFDTDKLQQQVTQTELDYYLKNGIWPWSQKVIKLYKEASAKNKLIRTSPQDSLNDARKIYNQNAILQILSYQTKEGQFLINGLTIHNNNPNPLEDLPSGFGTFGYQSGLIGHLNNDEIKCNIDPFNKNSHLEKIHYTGKGGIFGEQSKQITSLNYNDLESEIPGFQFIDGPCNPCSVFDNPSDYSCRYKLNNIPNQSNKPSSVWKYLWA